MLGIDHAGNTDIFHFKDYAGMSYRSIYEDILANHALYGGTALGSDAGAGMLYNNMLREGGINVNKHFIFQYVGPACAPIGEPHGEHMFNQYSLNRTESISALYEMIKSKKLRCYQWELAQPHLLQFLNLIRAPAESAAGATSFTYRKHGSKTDDPLHAVNFANVISRLLQGQPLIRDKAVHDAIMSKLHTAAVLRGGRTSPGGGKLTVSG